jgi:hypothetical protein
LRPTTDETGIEASMDENDVKADIRLVIEEVNEKPNL